MLPLSSRFYYKKAMNNVFKTRQRIHKVLHEVDNWRDTDERTYQSAAILLASFMVGPNIKRIAKVLKYPRKKVSIRSLHLRRNGIWKQGYIHVDHKAYDESDIAFLCDTLVANGECVKDNSGAYKADIVTPLLALLGIKQTLLLEYKP